MQRDEPLEPKHYPVLPLHRFRWCLFTFSARAYSGETWLQNSVESVGAWRDFLHVDRGP